MERIITTINAVGNGLSGVSGTGSFVGATNPNLVTPTLGTATATSVNFGGSALNSFVSKTSWNPTFTFATPGDLTTSSYHNYGSFYTQIGNIIFFDFCFDVQLSYTTASGEAIIGGLPQTANASVSAFQGIFVPNVFVNVEAKTINIIPNTTTFNLLLTHNNAAFTKMGTTNFPNTSIPVLYGYGFYLT